MIRCSSWDQTFIHPSVSKMIFSLKSEVFPWLYGSRDEAFVRLNYHEFQFRLDKTSGLALVREEIVADRAERELRL